MALSDVALCSRALVMIGAAPIGSLAEETVEAEVAGMLYGAVRDGLLGAYPWRFAARGAWLARLSGSDDGENADSAGDDIAGFDGAWQRFALPGDFVRLLALRGAGGVIGTFELRRDAVLCDADQVYLDYVGRLPEASFPAWFDLALIARLAAEFCLPLTESTARADYLQKRADEQLRAARLADAQQSTPHAIEDFTLISARG